MGKLAWAVLLGAVSPSAGAGQGMPPPRPPPPLTQFLQHTIGFTPDQVAAVTRGEPVVKALDPADHREVAVFGIVRVDVPRAFYVRAAADFPTSLRSPSRPRFALFSDPAVAADVATLSLPHDDIQELAHCRAGSCKLKLSAQAVADLGAGFDPDARDADSLVNTNVRQRVLDYATAYRARGNAALVVYVDQQAAESAAAILDSLLSRSPYLYQHAPSLERYLKHYPQDRPDSTREALFWSQDDLPSLKPTLTITHAIVYSPPELPGSTFLVAKQLYADHYLDGGLDVTVVLDAAGNEAAAGRQSGCYVVLLHRLHFDELPSGGLVNVRGKVIGKLRDETLSFLRDAKSDNERAWTRASSAAPAR